MLAMIIVVMMMRIMTVEVVEVMMPRAEKSLSFMEINLCSAIVIACQTSNDESVDNPNVPSEQQCEKRYDDNSNVSGGSDNCGDRIRGDVGTPGRVDDARGDNVVKLKKKRERRLSKKDWQQEIAKKNRNLGLACVSHTTKRNMPARKIGPPCGSLWS